MNVKYQPPKLEELYADERWLKKKYGIEIANGMVKFQGALDAADNAYDIKVLKQFFLEQKKGNLSKMYFVSLDKKHSKWRLPVEMLDENDNVLEATDNEVEFLKSVKIVRLKEMSDHYG